MYKKAEK